MYEEFVLVVFCTIAMANVLCADISLARNENAVGPLIAGNVLTEIYKLAGFVAHVEPMPATRAIAMASGFCKYWRYDF